MSDSLFSTSYFHYVNFPLVVDGAYLVSRFSRIAVTFVPGSARVTMRFDGDVTFSYGEGYGHRLEVFCGGRYIGRAAVSGSVAKAIDRCRPECGFFYNSSISDVNISYGKLKIDVGIYRKPAEADLASIGEYEVAFHSSVGPERWYDWRVGDFIRCHSEYNEKASMELRSDCVCDDDWPDMFDVFVGGSGLEEGIHLPSLIDLGRFDFYAPLLARVLTIDLDDDEVRMKVEIVYDKALDGDDIWSDI